MDPFAPSTKRPTSAMRSRIRWPPFYVVVAPHPPRVVVEGVAFAPDQVRAEIERWIRRDSETGQWRVVEEMR